MADTTTSSAARPPSVRPLRLPFGSAVAGVSFRQAELRDVVEGDHLTVVAAHDNPHDADACEVRTHDGVLLGFIPRALAGRLRASGQGPWPAVVDEVLRNQTWGLRITVHPTGTVLEGGRRERAAARAGGHDTPGSAAAPAGRLSGRPMPETVAAAGDGGQAASVETGSGRTVKAVSGRTLGTLLRVEGSKVFVDAGGREIGYPASAVIIEAAG